MEKKGNRTSPASRTSSADSKKDGIGKPWLRGSKCRESANGSLSNKGEPSRKPPPQKGKSMDKRPKPRGLYCTGVASRNEATILEEQLDAELGSVFLPGSKKQSLNHLLNFTYSTPREAYRFGRNPGTYLGRNSRTNQLVTQKHRFNKEHFLQANCQFVVNERNGYKMSVNNPDILVDWLLVEQVIVPVSEYPSCPICLYTPSAAKITPCGHIYCWPCALHYLSLSDERSRKCPICFEYIRKTELKSVITVPYSSFQVKDTITFKLMKRPKGGLTVYPADEEVKKDNALLHMSDKNSKGIYSKILLATREDIHDVLAREKNELDVLLEENKDCPEECFITEALELLKERQKDVEHRLFWPDEYETEEQKYYRINELNISSNVNTTDVIDNSDDLDKSSNGDNKKYYYFYQASDGQHIYLNALNAKMLEHTYGSLEFAPKLLIGEILEKEGGSMTLDLRKRLRCLAHLPITCQFEIAEIELKQPIVSMETLDYFRDKLESRRRNRQRKDRQERVRERRIELEENRKIGIFPTPNIQIESNVQFPEFGSDPRLRSESESTIISERSTSPDLESMPSASLEKTYAGPSFAKMLASKKKQPSQWPSIATSSGYADKPKLITVTGSNMTPNKSKIRGSSDTEADPEGYEPVPSFNDSFGDAIAQAFQQATISDIDEQSSGKKKKKKKKSKQKVLFTTNMAYSEK